MTAVNRALRAHYARAALRDAYAEYDRTWGRSWLSLHLAQREWRTWRRYA